MIFTRQKILFFIVTVTVLAGNSCRPSPDIVENKNIKGFVLGKETCNTDDTKDYWLIDFTYGTNNPKVGDTLALNGTTYTNVLKTKDLSLQLKTIGIRASIDYSSISHSKVLTTGCNMTNPVTYQLKEVTIQNQFEIR